MVKWCSSLPVLVKKALSSWLRMRTSKQDPPWISILRQQKIRSTACLAVRHRARRAPKKNWYRIFRLAFFYRCIAVQKKIWPWKIRGGQYDLSHNNGPRSGSLGFGHHSLGGVHLFQANNQAVAQYFCTCLKANNQAIGQYFLWR